MPNFRPNIRDATECKPLDTVDQVISWVPDVSDWSQLTKPFKPASKYCYENTSFSCHKYSGKPIQVLRSSAPKTLVCHDMKGGYIDDKFVDGAKYDNQYIFYYWPSIDIFVYFSHHFITIPPLMWINAAHYHNVEVLGTIISERQAGWDIWSRVLSNDDILETFVSKLVNICDHYNFDGYLLNIENNIAQTQLPKLVSFLEKFKQQLGSKKVIWYDSVSLITGFVHYQNELNEQNQKAFEICDGIFLNYWYDESNLDRSLVNAGARHIDVYVGIDVFGRGTYGGGGFDTDVAMKVIRPRALSVALFAPGWTYENVASDEGFFQVERKFWGKLWPYLYTHVPDSIPFRITFNQGVSRQKLNIKSPYTTLWYNLAFQKFYLPAPSCLIETFQTGCINHFFNDGIDNDSSMILNYDQQETQIHRLLLCDFECSERAPLKLGIMSKWPNVYLPFKLILWVEDESKSYTVILQVSKDNEPVANDSYDFTSPVGLIRKINAEKVVKVGDNDWISNEFGLNFNGKITGINAQLQSTILIGDLKVE